MTKTTKAVKKYIDNWRFWVTAFAVALAVAFYLLFVLDQNQNKESSARISAEQIANNNERQKELQAHKDQVQQCFIIVKNAPVIKGFLQAQSDLINNGILVAKAALDAQPSSPLTPVRLASIKRLEKAKKSLNALKALIDGSTRTKKGCLVLAKNLNIDPGPYLKILRAKKGAP